MERIPTSILCDERCHLGEGPTYDAATDTAWWFDILEGRLFEAHLGSGQVAHPPAGQDGERAGAHRCGAAADRRGRRPLHPLDRATARWRSIVRLRRTVLSTRSNDARVHASGTFWIGTMGRKAEAGAGAIYALHRGEISRLLRRHYHSERDLLLARRSARLFCRHGHECAVSRCARSPDRVAARRARGAVAASRRRRPRRCGGRCRGPDLECALGRRLRRRLQSARRASALLCTCRRARRVARPSSGRICRVCWSRRPGKTWTRRRVRRIPSMGARS